MIASQMLALAARNATVLAHGQTMTAEMEADTLQLLNFVLSDFRAKGASLGVEGLLATDEIYLDEAEYQSLFAIMSVRIGEHYGRPPNPVKVARSVDAEALLLARHTQMQELTFEPALRSYDEFDIDL